MVADPRAEALCNASMRFREFGIATFGIADLVGDGGVLSKIFGWIVIVAVLYVPKYHTHTHTRTHTHTHTHSLTHT